MMFLEYVEQINANIGMIDKNSTISVRGRKSEDAADPGA